MCIFEWFIRIRSKGYNHKTSMGEIKQVDIKFLNNQLLITIVATISNLPNIEHLAVRLNLLRLQYGIYLSQNNKDNTLIYGKLKHILGIKNIQSDECDIKSKVSPFSFLQVNNYIKEEIYKKICKEIKGEIVIDAYAGRGVLSAYISKKCKKVYAIEIEQSSVEDGIETLQQNNIQNVQYLCEDVKTGLNKIDEKINCIIFDPPRKGVEKEILQDIIIKNPQKIIYLSCSSDTLSRDLKILMNNYKIIDITPYDMFPNTSNVETLVIMEKIWLKIIN